MRYLFASQCLGPYTVLSQVDMREFSFLEQGYQSTNHMSDKILLKKKKEKKNTKN